MPIKVFNFDGSELIVDKPCERIVSLVPSETETLYEIGAAEKIVGITYFCVRPWSFYKSKTKVGGTKNPNIERIKELSPDLILCNREENTKDCVQKLREIAPVHISFPRTFEEAKEVVFALGQLTDCQERAEAINMKIDESLAWAQETFPALAGRSVLYLIWKSPYRTIGRNTYVYDVLTKAHIFPIEFPEESRYPEISDEAIESSNAQIVMFPDEPWQFTYSDIEEFRQKFPDLPAVKEHALFKIEGAFVSWFGYRTSLALEYLIHCLNLP